MKHSEIKDVREFWSTHPCGSDRSNSKDRKIYFADIERDRYEIIRHIPQVARFTDFKGKKVLEVGCGIGTDGRQFARNGAIYTGINLDEGSTRLAKEAFNLFGLDGTILTMNAEEMDFPDNYFDYCYSLGVIHHTPNPPKIVYQIFRVLKPGGSARVMVYNKSSINYWFEIMFLRKVFRYCLMPRFAPGLISRLTGFSEYKLKRHREIMLSEKMTHERWLSINTDGPDNPLSRVYSKQDALNLFKEAGFSDVSTYVRHFDKSHYSFIGKIIPDWLADKIGNVWGWCRWIEAIKPDLSRQ